MAVPDFQSLMRPVLIALSNGDAFRVTDVCARVADAEGLTPNAEVLTSGDEPERHWGRFFP